MAKCAVVSYHANLVCIFPVLEILVNYQLPICDTDNSNIVISENDAWDMQNSITTKVHKQSHHFSTKVSIPHKQIHLLN